MSNFENGYTFKCGGEELSKVLFYYGLIDDLATKQKIVCPFHNDVNPSMIIDLDKGTYFCFGCGESGDAFSFVKSVECNLSDLDVCKKFFEILRSDKCERLDFKRQKKNQNKSSKLLYTMSYDYFHGLKKTDWTKKNEETKSVISYMSKRGFAAESLNFCNAKLNYNKKYPIIFPIMDNGKYAGWVCRTTNKATERKRKYLYNEGFSRANTVVGDYRNCDFVYVVEGYMDKLRMNQNGVKNVVAIFGWYISLQQVEKLKKQGIKLIVSALDNDECGRNGTYRLKQFFDVVRFRYIKGVKDPGEMSKKMFDKMNKKTLCEVNKKIVIADKL